MVSLGVQIFVISILFPAVQLNHLITVTTENKLQINIDTN
jgi:hypothetical protein